MAELTSRAPSGKRRILPLVLALLCGIVAYANSFHGPFIFDDIDAIQNNPNVNRALPATERQAPTTLSGRPVLWATFALDYALAGLHVEAYHATNLLIHLACGAVLYGIVWRTLVVDPTRAGKFVESKFWLAGAVSAIWLVHPLNTEAVTYIVQRAESLAGLFYLLVIYCLIRGRFRTGAIVCALGMATKETMVAAPLMALLYDRAFLAGSFRWAMKFRRKFYAALAATWIIPLIGIAMGARRASVGGNVPTDYFLTQLGVVGHYVLLGVWPRDLVLDYYDWPVVHSFADAGAGEILVGIAIIATLFALFWNTRVGFLGAWFFGILAPSSSFIPVFTEIAAEHRMYLPLMAPVTLAVVGGWEVLRKRKGGGLVGVVAVLAVVSGLVWRTVGRNADYADPVVIWSKTVALRPMNPRAHFNLGYSEMRAGRPDEAALEFRRALDLEPDYYAAGVQLQRALTMTGGAPH